MSKIVACNSGTTGKTHARIDECFNHTLCGQGVIVGNKGDSELNLASVECLRCQKTILKKK